MNIKEILKIRSHSKCELCGATENLNTYEIPPVLDSSADKSLLICKTCSTKIAEPDNPEANHWRCLNKSIWSHTPAVQVVSWRILSRLKSEPWAQDLLDRLYLEEGTLR